MSSHPLVVGVDGSHESQLALQRAIELATQKTGHGGLDLVAVFVRHLPWTAMSAGAVVGLQDTADEIEAKVKDEVGEAMWQSPLSWRFDVRTGDPARELVKVANDLGAQTIVVGGHRHNALAAAIVQSVDSELVHTFAGDLVLVRPPITPEDGESREVVLRADDPVPSDSTPADRS